MMIQVSNPLSMLSGAENSAAVQQGLAEADSKEAFTSSLMQQLALLQGNAGADASVLTVMQTGGEATDGNVATGQAMQNFAALFGKALPTAKKIDQAINLDDTMSALSDVLQHLQDMEVAAEAESPAQNLFAADAGTPAEAANESTANGVDSAFLAVQAVDPASVMPVSTMNADTVKQPSAETVSGETQNSDAEQAEARKQEQQAVTKDIAGQALAMGDTSEQVLSVLNKNTQPAFAQNNRTVGFTLAQAGEDKQASLAMASDLANAMFNQDNDARSAGQEKQAALKTAQEDLAVTATQTKSVETDKNPSRLMGDIAQLNQAVSTEKTVEVPAMTRNLSHPEWNAELGEKLLWMHKQAIPSAELRINPQHLGPIFIKVDVDQDQASVSFTAQHAGVKDAIEAAIPKLREMLSGQQLNLVDVNVSQQQSEQKPPRDFFQASGNQGRGNNSAQADDAENAVNPAVNDIVDEIEAGRAIAGNGLLSLFA